MPIIKSAIKALRQDKKRALANKPVRSRIKTTSDAMKAKPGAEALTAAYSAIDKAAKRNIVHRNKAARLKSQLAKLLSK